MDINKLLKEYISDDFSVGKLSEILRLFKKEISFKIKLVEGDCCSSYEPLCSVIHELNNEWGSFVELCNENGAPYYIDKDAFINMIKLITPHIYVEYKNIYV